MIPNILWQTSKSIDDLDYGNTSQLIKSWVLNNPSLDCRFMDDTECNRFIAKNFSKQTYEMYRSLPLGIMRADFWRVAVVYINGGIYSDTDVFCKQSIEQLLKDKDLVILQEPNTATNVANFFFAAEPKHPFLKEVLEYMESKFDLVYDLNSKTLVQNFGMHPLQHVMEKYKQEFVSVDEHSKYMEHMCHGTWRESEKEYKEKDKMDGMTFFTTFNESGYELYGKMWIDTFKDNVAAYYPNAKAIVYKHGFELEDAHPQITIIDYDEVIPDHLQWKKEFEERSQYNEYIHKMTIRFSHKAFVIQHALKNISTKYAFWVDGDCIFHKEEYDTFPKNVLNSNAMACQVEHNVNHNHVESGILIFDMKHKDTKKWLKEFTKNYTLDEVFKMGEPYDGFIVFKSLQSSKIKFSDLNEKYGIEGIQSCPTLTFLHPELSKRFTHNIGLTGKSQYKDWEDVKYTDEVFRDLAQVGKLTEQQLKFNKMKRRKLALLDLK
jgi:hypothetical protein